jgi:formate-dependent nitrite reductase membrane component NrfD
MNTKAISQRQDSQSAEPLLSPEQGGALSRRGEQLISGQKNYYNLPLIKKAHWKWEVVLYFFLGGMAGGSYLAASLADLPGSARDAALVRAGRYLSFACIIISPILLIKDLGRPERFLHMMRVLKFRSAMSLGTWGLSLFGMFCGLTAAHQMAKDGFLNWLPVFPRLFKALPMKFIESIGSFFGLFVASYTGVLLASTAVPVWARARHILGPLFLTSGLSTGFASLSLILSLGRRNEEPLERLERAELVAMSTELGLISVLPTVLGPLTNPLFKGKIGALFRKGTIGGGLLLPLILRLGWRLTGKRTPRTLNIGASLLVLVGGLILRYVWIAAGRVSADDPRATHYYNAVEWKEKM